MEKKLYKAKTGGKIDGVCAGIARYLNVDVTLVRIIWVVFTLFGGAGILAYIVCAVIMPREPDFVDYTDRSNASNDERNGREN